MRTEYCSADTLELEELASLLNRCFAGYLFPVHFDRRTVARMVRVDSVDLSASVVVRLETKITGVALVARRGWNCRLAAMAIDPDFRGKGMGKGLTNFLLQAARDRGDRSFVLEVIEQNVPALRLYQAAGFNPVRKLVGYTANAIEPKEDADLTEIDPVEAAGAVHRWGATDLPWQISPHTLAALGPPHRAFRLGPATALMSDPVAELVTLCALVVESNARRQGWATRLLQALSARFPGRKWRFSILVPDEVPESFFMRLGFRKEGLNQIQMAQSLA